MDMVAGIGKTHQKERGLCLYFVLYLKLIKKMMVYLK